MTAIIRALTILIVKGMHSISIVDDVHFQNFVTVLDPRVKLPCRSTMTNKYLPQLYDETKKKLVEELGRVDELHSLQTYGPQETTFLT